MNEVMSGIIARRSIRKYKPEQISDDELNAVLQAGLYAPSASGRQLAIAVACQNKAINAELWKINRAISETVLRGMGVSVKADNTPPVDGFYGAPTLVTLFVPKDSPYAGAGGAVIDCSVIAQNIMLAAHSLALGSCLLLRAEETFSTEFGQKLLKDWGIEGYEAKVHITLGYPAEAPEAKPRRDGRVKIVS